MRLPMKILSYLLVAILLIVVMYLITKPQLDSFDYGIKVNTAEEQHRINGEL